MSPDDKRHGTNPGYLAGCREDCCRTAHAAYRRNLRARQYLTRGQLVIDGTGTRRRLRALVALGWALADLDKMIGQRRSYCSHIANYDGEVLAVTAKRIAELYDQLSMRLPEATTLAQRQTISRNRNLAKRKGWLPPLAWDDIDTDVLHAGKKIIRKDSQSSTTIDEAVVLRVLGGDVLPATKAEKTEIRRRWIASGRSVNDLARMTGWKPERYVDGEAA